MLSIIIPTFNEEQYLPTLLDSLQQQTFQQFEIIVADTSSDNTRTIAQQHGCTIVSGGNPAQARNNGAKLARYEHLLFLDADVALAKHTLHTLIKLVEKVDCASVHTSSQLPNKKYALFFNLKNGAIDVIHRIKPHCNGQCMYIKKQVYDTVGGFDISLKKCEEHDFIEHAIKAGFTYRMLSQIKVQVHPRRIMKEGFTKVVLRSVVHELLHMMRIPLTLNYPFGDFCAQSLNKEPYPKA